MVCASCEVTWRGVDGDHCWSCGDNTMVDEATPSRVRYSTTGSESDRLVG